VQELSGIHWHIIVTLLDLPRRTAAGKFSDASGIWACHIQLIAASRIRSQASQSALLSAQDLNLPEDAENFKELAIAVVQISQDDFALRFVHCLNHTEQQRNSNAVNEFSLFEVDDQISDPVVQHFEASPLDALAPQLIQVGPRVDDGGAVDESLSDFDCGHQVSPQMDRGKCLEPEDCGTIAPRCAAPAGFSSSFIMPPEMKAGSRDPAGLR
jgi:hypothetical protein